MLDGESAGVTCRARRRCRALERVQKRTRAVELALLVGGVMTGELPGTTSLRDGDGRSPCERERCRPWSKTWSRKSVRVGRGWHHAPGFQTISGEDRDHGSAACRSSGGACGGRGSGHASSVARLVAGRGAAPPRARGCGPSRLPPTVPSTTCRRPSAIEAKTQRVAELVGPGCLADEPEAEDERRRASRRRSAATASRVQRRGAARLRRRSRNWPPDVEHTAEERPGRGGRKRLRRASTGATIPVRADNPLAVRIYNRRMDETARHLRLLTETIAAVNSTLDLEEVLSLVASKVADALEADACFVYLYDERADELVLRATHGTRVEEMTQPAADAARARGSPARPRRARAPMMIADAGAPRPALQGVPEPARGRVRVDPRRADPRARAARGRAQRPHAGAARVHRGRDRPAARDRRAGGAVDRAREALRAGAAPRGRARGARADLRGGLRVALPGGVARGDRQDDDGRASTRPAPRSCSRTARSPGPRAAPAAHAVRLPLRWKRRQIGELVCDRDTPFTDEERAAARLDRAPRRRRARARARGHARRARPGDPPPRQEQPADRRVAAPAPGARRRRRRPAQGAGRLGQPHPRDRGRARGADRAAGRGRRARASCSTGCGRCSCRGSARRSRWRPSSSRSRSPATARPRWPSSSRAASERARARRRVACGSSWRGGTARSCSRSPTTAGDRRRAARAPASRSCARSSVTSSGAR